MGEKKETLFTIYMDGEKEKLKTYYTDLFSKSAIKKFSVSGEFANPEQVAADITAAKESGGYLFAYKRKKEVRAVCILAAEKHEAADEITAEPTMGCFAVKGFHVAKLCTPSVVEKYRRLFVKLIEEHVRLVDGGVLAYVWGKDIL